MGRALIRRGGSNYGGGVLIMGGALIKRGVFLIMGEGVSQLLGGH